VEVRGAEIGVDDRDAVTRTADRESEIRRDGRLADATFAAADRDDAWGPALHVRPMRV
jgi:hypothetical protein